MKTVIEMAREAGIEFTHDPTASPPKAFVECWADELERLVELARADEREACAQFLESTQLGSLPEDTALHYARLLKGFAEGIRARSNT
jgi:hypothetical protein